jgi:alpha-mannosidase
MNNYWETNYKSDQEGPTTFGYSLWPHGPFDPVAAARFGIERSQPVEVVPVAAGAPPLPSLVKVEPPGVMVTALKPAEDGKGLILRLYNAGAKPAQARLAWSEPMPKRVMLSSPREEEGAPVTGPIEIVPSGIVTLRVAMKE